MALNIKMGLKCLCLVEGANVGIRSQLQNYLEPHEHLGGYGAALLDCDASRVVLLIRSEAPFKTRLNVKLLSRKQD